MHRRPLLADRAGHVVDIDNRRIAKLAKLAGAPQAKAAGIELHVKLGGTVAAGEPICTVHAQAPGELAYALQYASANPGIIRIDER
jgi:thymidine phosphorylase